MSRDELLQPLLEGLDGSAFADWEVVPGFIDGEHAATAVLKGTEIHFGIVPKFRKRAAVRRRLAGEFIGPLLARWGFLTTRVLLTSVDKKRFVERVGFKPTWSDHVFQYYMLSELPFARSN